ncbi:MAG: phage portal protein, partial [Actinomycetota bacterium]|nr:phage portal protein [Actinomycetota bacterium]
TLWAGTLISYFTNGNAYWFKVRNGSKKVVELWYVPHFMVEPRWDGNGNSFITHYNYYVNGRMQEIPASEVVHFRFGIDPQNTRKGLSPLGALMREVVGDNEAGTYTAAILKNFGVPGVYISPGPEGRINEPERMKEAYMRRTTGDRRGEPIIFPEPVDIRNIAMSPEDIALDKIRNLPEARICGAMRVPAMVVGLSVGTEQRTYANYGEAREAAWEECLIPTGRTFGTEADLQIMDDFTERPSGIETFGFDYRNVRALQTDEDKKYKRLEGAVGGPFLTPNEARQQLALPPVEGGERLYPAKGQAVAETVDQA